MDNLSWQKMYMFIIRKFPFYVQVTPSFPLHRLLTVLSLPSFSSLPSFPHCPFLATLSFLDVPSFSHHPVLLCLTILNPFRCSLKQRLSSPSFSFCPFLSLHTGHSIIQNGSYLTLYLDR